MLESFVHPGTMLAGTLLVSVPIIIHLINRLRYKRIRWAAMEFLLRAQKRMKRKLILQQLLLLLLRCLLVFLLGLLAARFLGFSPFPGRETRTTHHLVILDDSPSMGDGWTTEDGAAGTSFEEAKRLIHQGIGPAAAEASSPQMLELIRLSRPSDVRRYDRINAAVIDQVRTDLAAWSPSLVRGRLEAALRQALALADTDAPDTARIVHVLSDFRAIDWELGGDSLRGVLDQLTQRKIQVHLIDTAFPFRREERRPPCQDNVGIVEFAPTRRVAARNEPVELTLRVRNFGVAELKDLRFAISVNGEDNDGLSVLIPTLPGNQEEQLRFKLPTLRRGGTPEQPLQRFNLITARLASGEPGQLDFDNVRHAVVELRERLPILAIDGRPAERDSKEGDSFYLRNIFTNVAGGFAWQPGTARDLETLDLRPFSCIFLMNVPALSEAAVKNLEDYVRAGGGVGFFLGPDVKPAEYNARLYRDGAGVFPVPLPEKPSDPMPDDQVLEKLFNFQKKVLLRDKSVTRHEALFNIYYTDRGRPDLENAQGLEKFFNFVLVRQYWPIRRMGSWRDDPSVTELYCLPNDASMGQYEPAAVGLLTKLPTDEPKYAKYREPLTALKAELRRTASSTEPLYKLAGVLDRLLADQVAEGDAAEALLREFWSLPELADLKQEAQRLRDAVKFGDPLYLVKTFGRGRVALITTTAGEQWTDWPAGPGGRSFPPIITEMERYLSGGLAAESPEVGAPINLDFDAAQYKPIAGRAFLTVDYGRDMGDGVNSRPALFEDLQPQPLVTEAGRSRLEFLATDRPGAYLFTLTRLAGSSAGMEAEIPEYMAVVCNVNSLHEGDLRRAGKDDVLKNAPGAEFNSVADADWLESLKNKRTDWTEAGWLFLILLLVLLAEQWLAVKLSFHAAQAQAPVQAPAVALPTPMNAAEAA